MARILHVALGAVAGYAVGAVLGAMLIGLLSGNTHDKSVEMVMTAAFVTGPLGAAIGLVAAVLRSRHRGPST